MAAQDGKRTASPAAEAAAVAAGLSGARGGRRISQVEWHHFDSATAQLISEAMHAAQGASSAAAHVHRPFTQLLCPQQHYKFRIKSTNHTVKEKRRLLHRQQRWNLNQVATVRKLAMQRLQ